MTDEFAPAKQRFLELVHEIDPDVTVVIPERATQAAFRISLTLGNNRRFLTLSEDEMLDLIEDDQAPAKLHARLRGEIAGL